MLSLYLFVADSLDESPARAALDEVEAFTDALEAAPGSDGSAWIVKVVESVGLRFMSRAGDAESSATKPSPTTTCTWLTWDSR